MEMERVTDRANELHGTLKKKADNDTAQMAVGMLLFWPTLFFLEGGDGPEATEYSHLKGERDALEKVAVEKQCGATVPTIQEVPAGETANPPLQEASTPAEAGCCGLHGQAGTAFGRFLLFSDRRSPGGLKGNGGNEEYPSVPLCCTS